MRKSHPNSRYSFRKGLCFFLCLLISMTAIFAAAQIPAYADKKSEAEQAQKEAEDAQKKSEQAEEDAEEAGKKAEEAEAKVEEAIEAITAKQNDIDEAEAKLEKTKAKLEKKQKEVESQEESLDSRLVAMYKTGTVGYVDVILNSNSIDELITNLSMVQKLLQSDQDLLEQLRSDYEEIEKIKKEQEEEEADLEAEKAELEALEEKYQDQADAYRQQQEELEAQAEEMAQLAKEKQEEAAKLLKEKGKVVNDGEYVWPCEGEFTSYYGWRTHPIFGTRSYHSGYDIAASTGTPVYSAANGVVTMASEYGGYGNCLQIYIGNGYTTLYGHLSRFAVSEGDYVTKGQVVAYVGSTGWSTGPHLHFSLLKNGSYVDPMTLY